MDLGPYAIDLPAIDLPAIDLPAMDLPSAAFHATPGTPVKHVKSVLREG